MVPYFGSICSRDEGKVQRGNEIQAMLRATCTLIGTLAVSTTLLGCGSDLYLMERIYQMEGGERVPDPQASCGIVLERGLDSQGNFEDEGRDLWLEESSDRKRVEIVVGSGDTILATRTFDRDFVKSGERNVLAVTTTQGIDYEIVHWGGDTCDASTDE